MGLTFLIQNEPLSLYQLDEILSKHLELSASTRQAVQRSRSFLDAKFADRESAPVYGINTGFGSLCDKVISNQDLALLQKNLVRSHACGFGAVVSPQITRLMLFLKIRSLAYGYSGVSTATIDRLLFYFNQNILPVVYEQGSLGASGDLAPLAHLSLPLIGEGEVILEGQRMAAVQMLQKLGLAPLELQSKEGLALLNGTQFMCAYSLWAWQESQKIMAWADCLAALSLDAFGGKLEPFDERLHLIRPHKGQIDAAKAVRDWLKSSAIQAQNKPQVQDPYSFRCVPQVHGASRDALSFCEQVFTTELNAVTDNPNVFAEDQAILSGGNFHGQPLALSLDFMALALSEIGSISERRTFQLISGSRSLPAFLIAEPGLNSGLMIPQYAAAAMASQNKQLCTPASADSIVSSNGQEDHVSMGANAATKLQKVVQNVQNILAVELLTAAQAMSFRRPLKTSPVLEDLLSAYTALVPPIQSDRLLYDDLQKTCAFMQSYKLPLLREI
ncbi:MAG: histidine ammonia-lyase [Cytophagales bacterium]|nr:MAG: histidine ammonia-lyase [Cytophagales bacterium]TAF60747.1 MAG: histidine ammonia-lyase [Cytophagales bacterium]